MSGAFDIRFIFHWNIKCRFDFRFQHSRKCHGFRRVTFRIASHDCTTEKSRDGFSEGKASARRWSDLTGESLTTEPVRTSTRTHSVHMASPGSGKATDRNQTQLAANPEGETKVDATTKTMQENLSEDNRYGATYAKGADGSASERHKKRATREKARDT